MSNNKLSSIDMLWNAIPQDVKLKMPFGIYEDVWAKHKEEMIDFAFSWSYDRAERIDIEEDYNQIFQ